MEKPPLLGGETASGAAPRAPGGWGPGGLNAGLCVWEGGGRLKMRNKSPPFFPGTPAVI